jgi:type I restriction enzyme S subunit
MKIEIQKYTEYKDSGMEWIGEIPSHWKVIRLKYIFRILKRIAGELGYNVLSITQTGIKVKDTESGEGQLSMDYSKYQIIQKGDFAMNHMDLLTGYVDISSYDGVISPDYRVFDLIDSNSDKSFMLLLLQLGYRSKIFYAHGQGVSMLGRWRFPTENFNDFLFPIPPKDEQTAIAAFLDRKTALIDQAIDIKQKQIELLKERRQILIHKAVTRGLNSNVKMKDSGVEWIGEIPEGWEVKKLRYLANCFPSNIDKHSKPNEKEVRLCNYTDVYKNEYITDDMELMIATASAEQITKFTLRKGDIIITKDSETASDIAVPTYIREKLTNVVCGYHLAVIRTYQESYNKYLFHALKTKLFNAQFEVCSNGITRVGLGNSDLKNGTFLLPAKHEQIEIAEYIEEATSQIATAISLKEQEIEKLKEYKATLINSAVTGKVKVV